MKTMWNPRRVTPLGALQSSAVCIPPLYEGPQGHVSRNCKVFSKFLEYWTRLLAGERLPHREADVSCYSSPRRRNCDRSRGRARRNGRPDVIRPAADHFSRPGSVEFDRRRKQAGAPDEHLRSRRTRLRIEAQRPGLRLRQVRIPDEYIAESSRTAKQGGAVDRAVAPLYQLALALPLRIRVHCAEQRVAAGLRDAKQLALDAQRCSIKVSVASLYQCR